MTVRAPERQWRRASQVEMGSQWKHQQNLSSSMIIHSRPWQENKQYHQCQASFPQLQPGAHHYHGGWIVVVQAVQASPLFPSKMAKVYWRRNSGTSKRETV